MPTSISPIPIVKYKYIPERLGVLAARRGVMILLNDYLYSGNTVLKILHQYSEDLKNDALVTKNPIDIAHCNYLLQQIEMLEHNDFLTAQSQKIREFYKYMAHEYPYLAFTFKGRIKSVIRAEEKFNGYIVQYIYSYYKEHGKYPSVPELKKRLNGLKDFIAYRIVISMPACHLKDEGSRKQIEKEYLYKIANALPSFLEERGFNVEISQIKGHKTSSLLNEAVRPYYKDYVENPSENGYQSLHVVFYDTQARCYFEVQIRTKAMDDFAEIGPANHLGYEKRQEHDRSQRSVIPVGECIYFDEAYERGMALQKLDLSKLNVNMFAAFDNSLINDGCGLYRGRLILPFEHLSRFQNDIID